MRLVQDAFVPWKLNLFIIVAFFHLENIPMDTKFYYKKSLKLNRFEQLYKTFSAFYLNFNHQKFFQQCSDSKGHKSIDHLLLKFHLRSYW